MFTVQRLRYELSAAEPLRLMRTLPTATIRGAFGYALAQVLGRDGLLDEQEQDGLYQHLFKPENANDTPIQHRYLARHYQLRGYFSRPDMRSFVLDLYLFGRAEECAPIFKQVVETMCQMGLGKNHQTCQCRLLSVQKAPPPVPEYHGDEDLAVQFVTPANRITFHGEKFTTEIPFLPLFNRLAWRVAELDTLYGDGTIKPTLDIPALQATAATIGHLKVAGGVVEAQRTSTRTTQVQYLDGFVGEMRYRGDFTPFLPILAYLPYVNVGHFNEGGCGWCRMKFVPPNQ